MAELITTLETARLRLRPFSVADVEAVHAYHGLDDVARFQYWEPRSREDVAAEVDKWTRQHMAAKDADCAVFAVTLRDGGGLIGDMVLLFRDAAARQGEIGFSFNPAFAGQGYATEAARAVFGFGFAERGLHRIFGRCDARNTGSWRLMERLGMRREAHFREHALFKGVWDEEYYYALLESEWAHQDRDGN